MQQMDVWSRDLRWPIEREEKGLVTVERHKIYMESQGLCNPLQYKSISPTSLIKKPILGMLLYLHSLPWLRQERLEDYLEVTGNLRFPLDNTYHGCPLSFLW